MAYKCVIKQRVYQRNYQRKQSRIRRAKLLGMLGGKCTDCGNADFRVLQIDHVKPILRKTRGEMGGTRLTARLLAGSEPVSEVVLRCANCHQIKTYNERTTYSNYVA